MHLINYYLIADPMYDAVVNEIEHVGSILGPQTEGDIQNLVSDLRTVEAGVQLKKKPQILAALKKTIKDLAAAAPKAAKIPKIEKLAIKTEILAKKEEQKFAKGKGSLPEINKLVKFLGQQLKKDTPK